MLTTHLRADDFGHIGSVNHGQPLHDQSLHLLLAAGIGVADVRRNGMVDAADLLPVGDLSGIDLPYLVRCQVLDGILGVFLDYHS